MDPIESGLIQMGNDIRAVIAYNGQPQIISLNKNQMIFLRSFFQTGSFKLAIEMAGVEKSTVRGWLKQKKFMEFLRERYEFAAKIKGFDIVVWKSHLIDIFLGRAEEKAGKASLKTQLEAAKILGKHFSWLDDDGGDGNGDGKGFGVREASGPQLGPPSTPTPSVGVSVPLQVPDGGSEIRKDPVNDLRNAESGGNAEQQDLVRGPVQEPSGGNSLGGFKLADSQASDSPVQRNEVIPGIQERKPDNLEGSR